MFTNGLKEEKQTTIVLRSIPTHIVHILMDFIYTGANYNVIIDHCQYFTMYHFSQ